MPGYGAAASCPAASARLHHARLHHARLHHARLHARLHHLHRHRLRLHRLDRHRTPCTVLAAGSAARVDVELGGGLDRARVDVGGGLDRLARVDVEFKGDLAMWHSNEPATARGKALGEASFSKMGGTQGARAWIVASAKNRRPGQYTRAPLGVQG